MHPAEQRVHDDVHQFGWHVIKVPDGDPEFAYTIGLFRTFGHPELFIIGLPVADVAHPVLNTLGDEVRAGRRFAPGETSDAALAGYDVTFRHVPPTAYREHLGWALWYYSGEPFPVLQVVYPDRHGHWPWAPEASDDFRAFQPVLDSPGPASSACGTFAPYIASSSVWRALASTCAHDDSRVAAADGRERASGCNLLGLPTYSAEYPALGARS